MQFVNLIIQIIIELNPVENKMILFKMPLDLQCIIYIYIETKSYNIDSACGSSPLKH